MRYQPDRAEIKVGDALNNDLSPPYVTAVTDNFVEVTSHNPLTIVELQVLFEGGWELHSEPRKTELAISGHIYTSIFHNPNPKVI